ncbi:MAG TPA: hypothetical protein EYP04_10705, partial [Anaerolineae bacterium]|nr:hypothetical protein [Anaerolineae bacterium]
MNPDFPLDSTELESVPVYNLDLHVDPENRQVTGYLQITVTNRSDRNWPDIYFRLYPNLPNYRGQMRIDSISSQGLPIPFVYTADRTAIQLVLPEPLLPNARATIEITYSLSFPQQKSGYVLFGESQGIINLPVAYPALAVPERAADGSIGWHLEVGPSHADSVFTEIGLFQAKVTVPADVVVAATGSVVTTTTTSDSRKEWHLVAGPNREFTLVLSRDFQVVREEAYGVTVNSYFLPQDRSAGQAAATYAAAILRVYQDHYGIYPYTELDVVESPLTYRG